MKTNKNSGEMEMVIGEMFRLSKLNMVLLFTKHMVKTIHTKNDAAIDSEEQNLSYFAEANPVMLKKLITMKKSGRRNKVFKKYPYDIKCLGNIYFELEKS